MTDTAQSPTAWATRAEPGARTTYFTGNLAVAHDRSGLRHRASEWFVLAERGLVILTQRRLGEGRYDYIAMRTTAPMSERPLRDVIADGRRIVDSLLDAS
ncbi:MAG: hypothetical protein ABW318_21255 [Vicinamibacterales bacterium]